ncbi:radical SAM family heme chaperone HemW [Clostridium sp. SHJSY1]|uniref:radical SAM family heme chaperone HemW n=1 Tax=Clostridium sp. SHJSY1 TaxID=2942483 RepID=UPI00287665A7|nr:radical SAM family heme chaperone HemW [Clostridium sp. SHJSY1]MDS0524065.1 radical SAM family heme chaperone HemW [Clostridium sp. SHJSY1]
MKEVALYIHIPFCKQKCFYCDFPSYACKDNLMKGYIDALCKEIQEKCRGYIIKSLFIGGGTPSYLDEESLKKLMDVICNLKFNKNAEKSMECNPGTVNRKKLEIIKLGGINRLSFGLQTTKNKLLKKIGRIHSYEEFKDNYYLAREIGFKNINVDMMFGLPEQDINDWLSSLEEIINLEPEHVSSYSLIIEEGTAFNKLYEEGELSLPSEDEERDMYKTGKEMLIANGYYQYEISNFAKEKKECIHNEVYWQCKEYIGVGVSSSSFVNNKRIKNIDSISEYIKRINRNESVIEEEYENTLEDNIEEFMFMGLRMIKGIDENEFLGRFGVEIDSLYKKVIDKNIKLGLLIREGGKIYLTSLGIEVSNLVMSDMIL